MNIEPHHAGSAHRRNIAALALALGVSRPSVYAWLELPTCPDRAPCGCFDLAAWRQFVAARGTPTIGRKYRTPAGLIR